MGYHSSNSKNFFIIDSEKYCEGTLKRIFFRSEKNMKFDINNLLKFCFKKQNNNVPFVSWSSKFIFVASLNFKNVGLVNTSNKNVKVTRIKPETN